MLKKAIVKVNMVWGKGFDEVISRHMKRLNVSRTCLIKATIEGLDDKQVDSAVSRGLKVLAERREKHLAERKVLREKISKISPEELDALLKRQENSHTINVAKKRKK